MRLLCRISGSHYTFNAEHVCSNSSYTLRIRSKRKWNAKCDGNVFFFFSFRLVIFSMSHNPLSCWWYAFGNFNAVFIFRFTRFRLIFCQLYLSPSPSCVVLTQTYLFAGNPNTHSFPTVLRFLLFLPWNTSACRGSFIVVNSLRKIRSNSKFFHYYFQNKYQFWTQITLLEYV